MYEVEDFLHEVVQEDGFAQTEAKISERVQHCIGLCFVEDNKKIEYFFLTCKIMKINAMAFVVSAF